MSLAVRLLLVLTLAPAVAAQTPHFGEAMPATHTRYGTFGAEPRLTTNGQHFFLLWADPSKVRITKLVDGERRAGTPILDADFGWFDVVWTGSHFLVAAYDRRFDTDEIRGRLLNANGDPVGDPFTIVARYGKPRLAFDGARVLMTHGPIEGQFHAIVLRPDGTPSSAPHQQAISPPISIDGAVANGGPGFVAAVAMTDHIRITTFHPNGDVASTPQLSSLITVSRRIAVASNGQDVLVAWTNGVGAVEMTIVRANGAISGRTVIAGTEGALSVAASWNGAKWIVSTVASKTLRTHVIDSAAPEVSATQQALAPSTAHEFSPVSVASLNGRTVAAWRGTGAGQPLLVRDLAVANNGQPGAFGAAIQSFHTATSSHDTALFVWSELRDGKRTLHAGARSENGTWRESRIGDEEDATLASSDGVLFLVVRQSEAGWSAVTLTRDAQYTASTPLVTSFKATGITWDGGGWVVIGVTPQWNILAVRVKPWGEVSAPVLIAERRDTRELENARIVWGGGGYFAVWQDSQSIICGPACDGYESVLHGARLNSNLQRIDTESLDLAPDEAVSPDVYWDGSRYVVFWVNGAALETRTIRPNASGSGITRIGDVVIDTGKLRVAQTPFGAAITSGDGEMLLIRESSLIARYDLGRPSSPDAAVSLGTDIAYTQTSVPDTMPYHGAPHLFLRVGKVIPPATLPDAPKIVRAAMVNGGNLMSLQWTAPIDPVNGFRIEYRVNDGVWNEFDEWFDAGTTAVSIRPWLDGAIYQFRVRAWSDAGVSGYSIPATVRMLGRRRSVRD